MVGRWIGGGGGGGEDRDRVLSEMLFFSGREPIFGHQAVFGAYLHISNLFMKLMRSKDCVQMSQRKFGFVFTYYTHSPDAKHCNNFFLLSVYSQYSLYCLLKLIIRIICLKIVIYEYLRKNMINKSNILPYTHLNYHMFISM